MPILRIYLFGAPRFELDGKPIHIPRRKAIALLAYLVTTGSAHSRDSLATIFWPEYDQSKARANLRRELSRIKTSINKDIFTSEQENVGLNPDLDYWSDIIEYQSRVKASLEYLSDQSGKSWGKDIPAIINELEECAALYSSEFMAGFTLPDCPQFDDWQFFERESLDRSLRDSLQYLVLWNIFLGAFNQGIKFARRILALDELSEPAQRQLMQLYTWSGQRGAAIRQYELSAKLLSDEIGVKPEDETVKLFEAIKSNRLAPPDLATLRHQAPWISAGDSPDTTPEMYKIEPAELASTVDLAIQATPFIGRNQEITQLGMWLRNPAEHRLITVIGPGGVGKTRLVLESIELIKEFFPDGVYIIPLVSLTSSDQIIPQIAEQLNFRFTAADGQVRQLYEYLSNKQLLLVLDNFEHLLSGSALLTDLLRNLPDITFLVTSRQRLNLAHEIVMPLKGMHYPDQYGGEFSVDELTSNEAIQLLVESARRIQPGFELAPIEMEPAGRLCRLLEGMPLAIILAASWLELLSIEEIIREVSKNLDFLASQEIDFPERQRSIRAVFNASWEALDEQEQDTLQRLTIFQGRFSIQAAMSTTGTSLQVLLGLVQKAWLQRTKKGDFQLHELQRQYAYEKLGQNPDAFAVACDEHAAYYASHLEILNQDFRGPSQENAIREIADQFVNIEIAWKRLVEVGKFETLVTKFLPPIYRYCEARIKSNQLLALVETALIALKGQSSSYANSIYLNILLIVQSSFYTKGDSIRLDRYDIMSPPAHEENIHQVFSQIKSPDDFHSLGLWASLFAYLYGRFSHSQVGGDYLRQLIKDYRQEKQPWELAVTLELLGGLNLAVFVKTGKKENNLEEAGQVLSEALAIFEQLGDSREYSYTLLFLGGYHALQGHLNEAIRIWRKAEDQFDQIGETITSLHWLMGDLLFKSGDYDAAFQYYREIRDKYLQRGHKRIAAYALSFESMQALRYSNIQHARDTREESLQLSREVGDDFGEAWSSWEMGEIERVAGNFSDARHWFEKAGLMFKYVDQINGLVFYHRGMGDIALAEGNYSHARSQFEASQQYAESINFNWGAAYAHANLARADIALHDIDSARMNLSKSLVYSAGIGDAGLILLVLNDCAYFYASIGEYEPGKEISNFVASHFATWNEVKGQALGLLTKLDASASTQQMDTPELEQQMHDLSHLVQRLLETDFTPV